MPLFLLLQFFIVNLGYDLALTQGQYFIVFCNIKPPDLPDLYTADYGVKKESLSFSPVIESKWAFSVLSDTEDQLFSRGTVTRT